MLFIGPNGEYPKFLGDVQLVNPDYQIGDDLPNGWNEVIEVDPPALNKDEVYFELAPELIDGVYTQKFATRPMTDDEIAKRDAPKTAKQKLIALGFSDYEIQSLVTGFRF